MIGVMTALARAVLEHADAFEWSVQGFGMIRTYCDPAKRYRLNVWDNDLAIPNVSLIHDHPWNFRSWILCGGMANQRFLEFRHWGEEFEWMQIIPGHDGGSQGPRYATRLHAMAEEHYSAGGSYHQFKDEIHRSVFQNGTVTINDRTERGEDVARVFWPAGEEWVDAKPRLALPGELHRTVKRALIRMMNQ